MKALIWKELRENYRWALLAILVLGGAEFFALLQKEDGQVIQYYFNNGITLLKKPFLVATQFGSAGVGLALGFLQVLPELKRDRWAALLHRPIARGRFFWGKAVAGVLLYLGAVGTPLLVSLWYVATPGHFSTPFLPSMIQPGLADLILGLPYYFAGLLMALEGGRFLLRGLPLLAALYVSFFSVKESLFHVVVEAGLAMAFVLCLAGWGAIHERVSWQRRPRFAQLALFVFGFYGLCGAGELGKLLLGMAGRMGERHYSSLEILDNGAPALLKYVNSTLVSTVDHEGKPFADRKYQPDRVQRSRLGTNQATNYIGDAHGWKARKYARDYRASNSYLWGNPPFANPLQQWFSDFQSRSFIGMQPLEKKSFAKLGADGFAAPDAEVQGFSEDAHQQFEGQSLLVAYRDSLQRFDLLKRVKTPILLPAAGSIYGMGHSWMTLKNQSISFEGVALQSGMAAYKLDGSLAAFLPYHYDVDRWGAVTMGVLSPPDRFVLLYEPSEWIDGKTKKTMPRYSEMMDAQGKVLASYTIQPPPPDVTPPEWKSYIAQRLQAPGFFYGEVLYRQIGAAFGSERLREALQGQWERNRAATVAASSVFLPLALALSIFTWFWARRNHLPPRPRWAWSALVLALGLPGFLLFWALSERPRTVLCSACRVPRQIEEEQCPQCSATWSTHVADGTEIIDLPVLAAPASL